MTPLTTGRSQLATFLMIGRLEMVELLGGAGFDAVVIDLEHGSSEIADLAPLAAAARAAGMSSYARLADRSDALIGRVLDSGVDGIIAPHVDGAAAARALVSASRFPPAGLRSLNPYVRGLGYGSATARPEPLVLAMIESAAALADVDEICATPGLDGVFLGPMDLSGSLGVPGQPGHPLVLAAMTTTIKAAHRHGRVVGSYAPTPDAARRDWEAGIGLVAVSADIRMVGDGFAAVRRAVGPLA